MNSHELHSETCHWAVPKMLWMERIYHICENRNIEDENHFLLECPAYNHIRSQFQNLCCNTNLSSLLRCQNYSELGRLLSKLFEHKNKILKQNKKFISLEFINIYEIYFSRAVFLFYINFYASFFS